MWVKAVTRGISKRRSRVTTRLSCVSELTSRESDTNVQMAQDLASCWAIAEKTDKGISQGVDIMTTTSASRRHLTGRCLCGAVTYQVADAFQYAMNCHCTDCRRTTGSAFKPFAGIAREHLTMTNGADSILIYGDAAGAHDVHCGRCGSLLFSVVREGAYVHVTLGTLTDAPSIRPSMHIFVASKAPWHEITDDLPQHARFPGE